MAMVARNGATIAMAEIAIIAAEVIGGIAATFQLGICRLQANAGSGCLTGLQGISRRRRAVIAQSAKRIGMAAG